jgi:uncharacterized SAM-binding protein YcdF (DUF218 family)
MVKTIIVLFLTSLTLLFQSCAYTSKTGTVLLERTRKNPADIVIVPGIPFENGQWSYAMKGRVYWAVYLYRQGIARNIMFSGGAVYTPYTEASIMALYAEKLGIPPDHVFTETLAQHSTENIFYGFHKARQLGFSRIALASDPFQTRMLRNFARKHVDPDVAMLPMVIDTMKTLQPEMIDPQIDYHLAFDPGFTLPLDQKEGFFKRFRGTLGRGIDTAAVRKPIM